MRYDEKLKKLLFRKNDGLLIKYHFNQGLDKEQLDELYDILERIKSEWTNLDDIPKAIVFQIIPIISLLRRDLDLYKNNEEKYYDYEECIDHLDDAIYMCLNPNINDPHFHIPLKKLGDI